MTAPAFDIKDAISEAVSSAMATTATEQPLAPTVEEVEDTETLPDEEEVAEDAPSEEDAPAVEDEEPAEAEAITLPDGFVAVPTVEGDLVTEFTVLDAEGEVEIPALTIKYKANGKVREDRLDQVVKLAQWGAYSQERETRLKQETEERVQEMASVLEERERQMEQMLVDDEFRERVYEAYLRENSPEKRAERAEEQVQNLRVAQELQKIEAVGEQFFVSEVEPALQLIAAALPTITVEELESKLEMAMMAQVETAPNGVPYVPPSRYEAIRKYIVEDLALWAQAAHNRRHQPAPAKDTKAQAELERVRIEAQKAKRAVGQKLKPVGKAASVTAGNKPAAKPATVDDAVASALNSALASFRG